MRLYSGDVNYIYDTENFPVGSSFIKDNKFFKFVKIAGAAVIPARGLVNIDGNNVATVAVDYTTTLNQLGMVAMDVSLASGDTGYLWVQVSGPASISSSEAATTDLTSSLVVSDANAQGQAYSFAAGTAGSPTDAELNDLALAIKWAIAGNGTVGTEKIAIPENYGDTTAAFDGTTTVTGVGTKFTEWFQVGDIITIGGVDNTITAVTDDTTLAVTDSGDAITATTNWSRKRKVVDVLM